MRCPLVCLSFLLIAFAPAACGGRALEDTQAAASNKNGDGNGGATQCTPHASPRSGSSYYGTEALPSGACNGEPPCDMAAVGCACGEHPYNGYHCSCEKGAWSCVVASQGASVCSCPTGGGGAGSSGAGSSSGSSCSYPPVHNDPRCPSSYQSSQFGRSCAPIGLSCAYPGVGDGDANGCFSTAMMWCTGRGGVGDVDGGADGGSGTWVVAQ